MTDIFPILSYLIRMLLFGYPLQSHYKGAFHTYISL